MVQVSRRTARWAVYALAAVIGLTSNQALAQVFDDRGFNRNRDFFSQLPFEHIDPLTGNLLLTHTDLALPGNAGFDLRIQRTYNSKIHINYNLGQTDFAEHSWAGVGWTLHMGRVFNALGPGPPVVEMPDGSRHPMFDIVGPGNEFISRDYWIYDRPTRVLRLPNGIKYTFARTTTIGTISVAYATEIRDPFDNTITIHYLGAPFDAISSIVQDLGGAQRTITFTTVANELREMRYASSVWNYAHQPTGHAGYSYLSVVDPPVGQGWEFVYHSTGVERHVMKTVITPHGGRIEYGYSDFTSRLGNNAPVKFLGVSSREILGRDVPTGRWNYLYAQGEAKDQTVIEALPCNTVTTMRFLGVGNTTSGSVWRIGLLAERTVTEGTTILQSEVLTWRPPLLGDRISDDDQSVGNNTDTVIYVPLVGTRTVTRNGRPYATTNTYHTTDFNDYGRPWQIDEVGDLARKTTRIFDYDFGSLYIKDKVKSVTIEYRPTPQTIERFTKSFEYENSTGFLTDETIHGILKEYTATARGNVATIVDRGSGAGGNTTRFPSYLWSQPESIETPEFTFTRVINPNGTIASETRPDPPTGSLTTGFQYDALFRPTLTTPPAGGGNPTITEYDNSGDMEHVILRRGSSWTRTNLDGFGRPSSTENSEGIKTDIGYDACGRRVYEGYPYEGLATNNIGSTLEYDGLDRIRKKRNPGLTEMTYTYSGSDQQGGIDVSITNERGKTTVQTWKAFGDPADARLARVRDAEGNPWLYTYNAVGSLTSVDGPGAADRTWSYFSAAERPSGYGLLKSESHPENDGRLITYGYHPNGLLVTRTDPRFGTTTYLYDGNNRLRTVNRPDPAYNTTITYDAFDNRRSLANSYVSSTFDYDDGNRLTSRTDSFGGQTFATGYTPDGNDNVRQIDYHSGLSITYDYDTANRITAVWRTGSNCLSANANCFARTVSYHPSGGISSFVAGNGGTHTVGYDSQRYWVRSVNAGGHLVLGYQNYDGVGNVGDITDSRSGFNQHFGYDNLDRLTTGNGPWGAGSFGYDDQGNRTRKTIAGKTTFYTYAPSTQRLVSADGEDPAEDDTFLYDFNGNLTSQNGRTYTYTPENMLETATVGTVGTTYRYDGDNLRKIKDTPGSRRFFVHGLGNQLLSEWQACASGPPRRVKDNVYLGSRLLASIEPVTTPLTASFTANPATVTVGEGSTAATTGVSLVTGDGLPVACPVTVTVSRIAGSALAGQDFSATPQNLTFDANSTSGRVLQASLGVIDDALDENDGETYTLSLSSSDAQVGSPAQVAVSITDNDLPPVVTTHDNTADPEGDSGTQDLQYIVSLNAASGLEVRVDFVTADITCPNPFVCTARAGADYLGQNQRVTFPPGTTSQSVIVPIIGERVYEPLPPETFWVKLLNPMNATVGTPPRPGGWQGAIVDNDTAPTVSVSDCSLVEGNSGSASCAFTVKLSNPSSREVGVSYSTAAGTATIGTDYQSVTPTPLTFAAESDTQAANVSIQGDTTSESHETFLVNLSNPSNVTISDAQAIGTILDDEADRYYTVAPCRVLDTRQPVGPSGGPILASGELRSFPVTGLCGVPAAAKAVMLNVTTTAQTQGGSLKVFPAGLAVPATSVMNFAAGQPRANNATVLLGTSGHATAQCSMATAGQTHVIVDVFGYYR
jgi:YD repeat-containing protein